jgi:hypothetical protein
LAIGPEKRLQNFSINLPASPVSLHSFEQELYSQSGQLLLLPATQNTYFSFVRDTHKIIIIIIIKKKKKISELKSRPRGRKIK